MRLARHHPRPAHDARLHGCDARERRVRERPAAANAGWSQRSTPGWLVNPRA